MKPVIEIRIDVGAMSATIKEQLDNLEVHYELTTVNNFEKLKQGLNVLFYNDFIEEPQYKKLCKRLITKITVHLAKMRNPVVNVTGDGR